MTGAVGMRAVKGSALIVYEDGIECKRLETPRFFIPIADVLGARSEHKKHRVKSDEHDVVVDFRLNGETLAVRFRMVGIRPGKQAEGFCDAVGAAVTSYRESQQPHEQDTGLHDLERLAELRDKGILTEEEFVAKKRQILGL